MILEMLAGCGCAVAGVVVGHFEGFLMGSKVRNVTELFAIEPVGDGLLICLCSHGKNAHQDGKRHCVVYIDDSRCACNLFVGDPSRQPVAPKGELEL